MRDFFFKQALALRSLLCIAVLSLIGTHTSAQDFVWAHAYEGSGYVGSSANSVAVAENDNIYVCGVFQKQIKFDGTTLRSNGESDGFLAKLDSSGNILWSRKLGASLHGSFLNVAVDQVGEIYASATFSDSLFIGSDTLVSDVLYSGVLIKYNAEGDLIWHTSFPNFSPNPMMRDIHGNVYVGFTDYTDVNSNPGFWLGKFGPQGQQFFLNKICSQSNTHLFVGVAMSIDSEQNVYVKGLAYDEVRIGDIVYSTDPNGSFLQVKISPSGIPIWARLVEDVPDGGINYSPGMTTDGFGNSFHHVFFNNLSLIKLNSDGDTVWKKRDETKPIGIHCLLVDENGSLLTAGTFNGDFTLGQTHFKGAGQTIFIAEFDSNGDLVWASQETGESLWDYPSSLARSQRSGALFVAGHLQSLASTFGNLELPGQSLEPRAFIAKFQPAKKPLRLDLGEDRTICEGQIVSISADNFTGHLWNTGSTEATLNVSEPGIYVLRAYDKGGYAQKDSVPVNRCLESSIPNVITPDGDFYNEYFVIAGLDLTKPNRLSIFNRWGKQVYSNHYYQNNWNGSEMPEGTYFYQLLNGADGRTYKGWVKIIR